MLVFGLPTTKKAEKHCGVISKDSTPLALKYRKCFISMKPRKTGESMEEDTSIDDAVYLLDLVIADLGEYSKKERR